MTNSPQQAGSFSVVAIDGGAASGKSSTSILLAEKMNLLHVDTGSHYRAVTYACLRAGLPPVQSPRLEAFLLDLKFSSVVRGHESLICLDRGSPLTASELRSAEVNAQVSPFSALPVVRNAVKAYQQNQVEVARRGGFSGIVMEGRDIGTVILPHANLKIFLQADPATRQQRREREGATDAIGERDRRDSSRSTAPLKPAADAVMLDNSSIGLEQVVDRIIQLMEAQDINER